MALIDTDKLPHYDGTALSAVAVARAVENAQTIDVESLIIQHEDIGYERGYRDGYAEALEANDAMEFEWCHDCKEYDQEAHCCHRWTKVIRNTVNDLKSQCYEMVKHGRWIIDTKFGADVMSGGQMVICSVCGQGIFWGRQNYCPNCGAKMDVPDTDVGKKEEKHEI